MARKGVAGRDVWWFRIQIYNCIIVKVPPQLSYKKSKVQLITHHGTNTNPRLITNVLGSWNLSIPYLSHLRFLLSTICCWNTWDHCRIGVRRRQRRLVEIVLPIQIAERPVSHSFYFYAAELPMSLRTFRGLSNSRLLKSLNLQLARLDPNYI